MNKRLTARPRRGSRYVGPGGVVGRYVGKLGKLVIVAWPGEDFATVVASLKARQARLA